VANARVVGKTLIAALAALQLCSLLGGPSIQLSHPVAAPTAVHSAPVKASPGKR